MYHNRVRGVSSEGIILLYLTSESLRYIGSRRARPRIKHRVRVIQFQDSTVLTPSIPLNRP